MKFGFSIGIFLNSANLICRSTDISKCFRGSLRLPDNESRLYLILAFLLKTAKLKKSSKSLSEYNKPGGYKQAAKDFYYLGPKVKVDRQVNLQLYESAQRSKCA